MFNKRLFCFLILLLSPLFAAAHGPTPKKAVESIDIGAPAEKVWSLLKKFDGIAKWHPMIVDSRGDTANDPGASERTLTFKNGGKITESLDTFDDANHEFSYRLAKENVEAFPISFYTATVKVTPGSDGGSRVEWKSRFYRGDTGNFPPEHLNDEAAIKAMNDFFKSGLEGLKSLAEEG